MRACGLNNSSARPSLTGTSKMAGSGFDLLVAYATLTTKGSIGAQSAMRSEEAAVVVQRIIEAGSNERPDVLVLHHRGPIAEPADAAWIIEHARDVDGLLTDSSIERLATQVAITLQTRSSKSLRHTCKPVLLGANLLESQDQSESRDPLRQTTTFAVR